MENTPQFRLGMPEDTPLILHFIHELAAYEKMEDVYKRQAIYSELRLYKRT